MKLTTVTVKGTTVRRKSGLVDWAGQETLDVESLSSKGLNERLRRAQQR